MNKTLYDELNVPPTASGEEISKAYKDKAKKCHPDKNRGDGSKMTALNHAYGILKNPAKRTRYDETGEESETPFDVKFAGLVQDIFVKIIDQTENIESTDMVELFADMLDDIIRGNQQEKSKLSKKQSKMKKVLDRLVSKSGDNKISYVLANNLENIKRELVMFDEQIEFFKKSREIITHYDYKFEENPQPVKGQFVEWNNYAKKW